MRIIHSSDWHLGMLHGAVSRAADHDHFFEWLLAQLTEQAADTLLLAGDVFDSMQPSADALRRYYRFLVRVAGTGVKQVVVVGGNHDSASRLEAPAEVLAALDVHVVGGVGGSEASWASCLVPLRGRGGDIEAVCLAVPYVHEFRLGVRTSSLDLADVRESFRERFTALYAWLADEAERRWPGLPIVATGHLTLGAANPEDYPHEIHQVGTLDGLPESILDPRIRYAALGHIHSSYPVGDARRAWYSGSPIAFSLPEARRQRRVLQVDIDGDGAVTVAPLLVPGGRDLLELRGTPEALDAALRGLTWTSPLPPLLFCRVVADVLPSDMSPRLHEVLAVFPDDARPVVVELRQERASVPTGAELEPTEVELDALSPVEVFATLCRSRGQAEDDVLMGAFAQLASVGEDDFQAMLAAAAGGER